MATNEATLKKLSTALQNLIKNSKKGGTYVKGGMYGVEQIAKIIQALDVYVRAYLDLNYQDINKVINTTDELNSLITIIGGIPFDTDLVLTYADNNKKYIYVGDSTDVVVYPPTSEELLAFNDPVSGDQLDWQVTLENGSINGSDIAITAQEGSTIDSTTSIAFDFGFYYQISWDKDDNFSSKLGSGGGGSGSGHTIKDEGTPLTDRSNLNFVGEGVTVTDSFPDTIVTIPNIDLLTDHLCDVDSLTYYYYGLNRNGLWEILRNQQGDVNNQDFADINNNGSFATLALAWTDRLTLTYT